ncbi:MAG: hypothetical protein ACLTXT_07480 [Ruminococcus callidus]
MKYNLTERMPGRCYGWRRRRAVGGAGKGGQAESKRGADRGGGRRVIGQKKVQNSYKKRSKVFQNVHFREYDHEGGGDHAGGRNRSGFAENTA